jgi:hypothetical protein
MMAGLTTGLLYFVKASFCRSVGFRRGYHVLEPGLSLLPGMQQHGVWRGIIFVGFFQT